MTKAPLTRGTVPDYLREAEARGAVPAGFQVLGLEPLTGGRTGARVTAIRPGYVLKMLSRRTWRVAAMQAPDAGEGPLWLSGATRELPAPVACPTVDVAVHADNDEWWMLMRDVSDGIRPRGAFTESDERVLLAAIARLHAHYWDGRNSLDRLPLAPARGATAALAEPIAFAAGRAEPAADWVPRFVEDFAPLRMLLPTFLEMLGPAMPTSSSGSLRTARGTGGSTMPRRRSTTATSGARILPSRATGSRCSTGSSHRGRLPPAICNITGSCTSGRTRRATAARPKPVRRCATSTWPSSRRRWDARSTARNSSGPGISAGCGSCR